MIPLMFSFGIDYVILLKNNSKYYLIPILNCNGSIKLDKIGNLTNISFEEVILRLEEGPLENLYNFSIENDSYVNIYYTGRGYVVFELEKPVINSEDYIGKRLYFVTDNKTKEYEIKEIPFEIENKIKEKIIIGVGMIVLFMLLL